MATSSSELDSMLSPLKWWEKRVVIVILVFLGCSKSKKWLSFQNQPLGKSCRLEMCNKIFAQIQIIHLQQCNYLMSKPWMFRLVVLRRWVSHFGVRLIKNSAVRSPAAPVWVGYWVSAGTWGHTEAKSWGRGSMTYSSDLTGVWSMQESARPTGSILPFSSSLASSSWNRAQESKRGVRWCQTAASDRREAARELCCTMSDHMLNPD